MCSWAARFGNIELLAFLRRQGCPWSEAATDAAFASKQMAAFQWLRTQDPPCPWDGLALFTSLGENEGASGLYRSGQRADRLNQLARDIGSRRAPEEPAQSIIQLLQELPADKLADVVVSDAAAACGHVLVMDWLLDQQVTARIAASACASAATYGRLPMLQWLRSLDPPCPWDAACCVQACQAGHLNVLQWLRSQYPPCPWSSDCCVQACQGGHLDMLRWLRSQDPPCPWTPHCYLAACRSDRDSDYRLVGLGQAHIVQWLRSQDPPCPWISDACTEDSESGIGAVLGWLAVDAHFKWSWQDWATAQESCESALAGLPSGDWLRLWASEGLRRKIQRKKCHAPHTQYLRSEAQALPELCIAAAARGLLEVLRWLLHHPPQAQHAPRALQAAIDHDQLEVMQWLLSPRTLGLPFPKDLTHASPRCLLALARAGCPMRRAHPHQVRELVNAWYAFVGLVRWAAVAGPGSRACRAAQSIRGPAGRDDSQLTRLSHLPSDVICKIADDALLGPGEAKRVR